MLQKAQEADFQEVVELANVAYRKVGEGSSWNSEAGIIEGQRLSLDFLLQDLAEKPAAVLLVQRDSAGILVATVRLEPQGERVWYLGLLTVRPERQAGGPGRSILLAAEDFARERGGRTIRISVLWLRNTLVAWYGRRGYAKPTIPRLSPMATSALADFSGKICTSS